MVKWNDVRQASKPERIGKKYQWIAYHEILAYIADRHQYREQFGSVTKKLKGMKAPGRSISATLTLLALLKTTLGGTSWGPNNPSWWGNERYDAWDEGVSHQDWLSNCENLPDIEGLLEVVNPADGTRWFNVNGSFLWRQPHPADEEPYDRNRKETLDRSDWLLRSH